MKISIVIPTYNRKELLRKTIDSLIKQNYSRKDYEIIAVDDGSIDGTEDMIQEVGKKSPVKLKYYKQENKGPAAARNVGIKNAQGDIIAFTDDDCIADEKWINEIVRGLEDNRDSVGIEGKTITKLPAPLFSHFVESEGGQYVTCNIAYRRKILEEINGFDENFPYPQREDSDLAFRAMKKGRMIYSPSMIVFHPPSRSSPWKILNPLKFLSSDIYLFHKMPREYVNAFSGKPINLILRKRRTLLYSLLLLVFLSLFLDYMLVMFFLTATMFLVELYKVWGDGRYEIRIAEFPKLVLFLSLLLITDLMLLPAYFYHRVMFSLKRGLK